MDSPLRLIVLPQEIWSTRHQKMLGSHQSLVFMYSKPRKRVLSHETNMYFFLPLKRSVVLLVMMQACRSRQKRVPV